MTRRQEELVLAILFKLLHKSMEGSWPCQKCRFCYGKSAGYRDNRRFEHNSECLILDVDKLKELTLVQEGGGISDREDQDFTEIK